MPELSNSEHRCPEAFLGGRGPETETDETDGDRSEMRLGQKAESTSCSVITFFPQRKKRTHSRNTRQ